MMLSLAYFVSGWELHNKASRCSGPRPHHS